jgi:hypothetical protein
MSRGNRFKRFLNLPLVALTHRRFNAGRFCNKSSPDVDPFKIMDMRWVVIWLLSLSLTRVVSMAQVTGRVTNTLGEPVSGVTVITPLLFQAKTTATGEYVLNPKLRPEWKPRLVIFYAPGFRPVTKRLPEGDSVIDAVIGPADGSERRVNVCSAPKKREQRMAGMRFAIPPGVTTSAMTDTDYTLESIVYRSEGKPYVLSVWEGPSCCSGRPHDDSDVIASSQTMRTWIFADPRDPARRFGGLDLRGKGADGTNWRWLGPTSGSQIEYKGVTDAVSSVFDAIIDSMCVVVP